MKNLSKFVVLMVVFGLLATASASAARPEFSLPEKAVEVSNGVFSLGTAYDVDSDSLVEGYAIVHKKGNAKGGNGGSAKSPKAPSCYAVMASGAKWKNVENWEVFPGAGLSDTFLLNNLAANITTWENAAADSNILGAGSLGTGAITDPYVLDEKNQVSFGDLESGTIAVTVVWGNFSGPVTTRALVAWDQIYNTDFAWTADATVEPAKMDFWNIAIHELGHSMGLADIYQSGCSGVTMYGYATEGETSKRTLEKADIAGINTLY